MRMKKDKGFSLIELVVVIAIMVILTLGISIGISALSNREAKEALQMIQGQLTYTQSYAMSKTIAYGEIEQRDDGYYYVLTYGKGERRKISEKKLCSNDCQILCKTTSEDAGTPIDEEHPCILSFSKSSGSFLPMIDKVEGDAFVYKSKTGENGIKSDSYCEEILITRGNYSGKITLYPKTGKCVVE